MIRAFGVLVVIIFRMVNGAEMEATTSADTTIAGGGLLGVAVGSTMIPTLVYGLLCKHQDC